MLSNRPGPCFLLSCRISKDYDKSKSSINLKYYTYNYCICKLNIIKIEVKNVILLWNIYVLYIHLIWFLREGGKQNGTKCKASHIE